METVCRSQNQFVKLKAVSQIKLALPGERYVYKFVCDPDALFQMALAENHRTALKMEANSIATSSSTSAEAGADYAGFHDQPASSNARCRHQYSDMLNQVYTSHLHAQLHQHQPHQVPVQKGPMFSPHQAFSGDGYAVNQPLEHFMHPKVLNNNNHDDMKSDQVRVGGGKSTVAAVHQYDDVEPPRGSFNNNPPYLSQLRAKCERKSDTDKPEPCAEKIEDKAEKIDEKDLHVADAGNSSQFGL